MPSSRCNTGSLTLIWHDLELFYDTPIVCGCLKFQGLKESPRRVTLIHYTNDILPNVDGLISPIAVKNIIGDIENTHKNTFLYTILKNLE